MTTRFDKEKADKIYELTEEIILKADILDKESVKSIAEGFNKKHKTSIRVEFDDSMGTLIVEDTATGLTQIIQG